MAYWYRDVEGMLLPKTPRRATYMASMSHSAFGERPLGDGVFPPKQARSAATFQRILDATDALLRERDFEEISVFEICATAKVSVSSLYSRFESKQAILATLCDEMARTSIERMQSTIATVADHFDRTGELDLMAVARVAVDTYARQLQENRRLVSSLQAFPALWRRHQRQNNFMVRAAAEQFLQRLHIEDPVLVDRIAILAAVLGPACQRMLIDGTSISDLGIAEDALLDEMATMAASYFASPRV